MTAQPGQYQASCNGGELADELHGRTDIKQYYSGLKLARNIEPVPQAGARLAPRSRHKGKIRRSLQEVTLATTHFALGPHATGPKQVARATFAGAARLAAIRFDELASDQPVDGLMQAQVLVDGSVWQDFGEPFSMNEATMDARTRMVAVAPGEEVVAFGVRLFVMAVDGDPVTFMLPSFAALAVTEQLAAVRLKTFTFSRDQTYVFAFIDEYADIWRDGEWVAMASTAVAAADLPRMTMAQRFDTGLLFHHDERPKLILRDSADNQWVRTVVTFTDIPQVNLGGVYVNAVSDVWQVYIRWDPGGDFSDGANLRVNVRVNGEETGAINTGSPVDWTQFAADLQAALIAGSQVDTGVIVSVGAVGATFATISINFAGDNNEGQIFTVTAEVVNTAEAAATVAHTRIGEAAGEPLMSGTVGWPQVAAFFQDRLISGGFKAKRSAFLASASGEYFDVNIKNVSSAGALLHNMDTDGAEEIVALARSRHLVIFTSEGEYFISDRALDRNQVPNIVNCSRNGIAAIVPVLESEAELLYLTPDRGAADPENAPGILLYAMHYDDVAQAYVSEPLSLLASHIVRDVIDACLQKASSATDANRLWMVREDGTMTLGVLIRNQEVAPFVRWQTDGQVKATCCDAQGRVYVAVQRETGGEDDIYLEQLEDGLLFDGTVEQDFSPARTEIDGLDVHEGAEVWAKADGYVSGPYTVVDGAITLANASENVLVGRWTAPSAKLLPLPREIAERTVLRRPARVHTVKIDLLDTTSLAIGANDRAAKDVTLYRISDPADAPPPPFSGLRPVYGLRGFSDEGIVEITQTKPGALQWRGITVEARL